MRKRGESERLRRSTVPGFAVPWKFLAWAAAVLSGLFGFSVLWLCVAAWPGDERAKAMAAGAPFVIASWLAAGRLARSGDDLGQAERGVRLARVVALIACATLPVATMLGAGDWGPSPELSMTLMFTWVVLVVGPLALLGRRLHARALAGDPVWDPHQANMQDRGDTVMVWCTAVGALSCMLVSLAVGLRSAPRFTPEFAEFLGVHGALGLVIGAVVGAVPGAWLLVYLNDRNLARCLPPITIAAPLTGMAGALIGPGWGVLGVAAAILVVGTVMGRRHRIFDPHRCQSCGYHLTGLSGGVCPECGTGRGQA